MKRNFDSSVGATRRRIPLTKNKAEIKIMTNLYQYSSLAFFFLNRSPSFELLIKSRSFTDSMPTAEKSNIKHKERKVKISEYS
jgi:hypothetical protein